MDELLKKVKVNKSKCRFLQHEVEYLVHLISAEGIRPGVEKLTDIKNASVPKDVSQLPSFVGMLTFL
uniref:Reverse transcriptase domain-containing protein n=1 Tax=Megaselia scalaris TaxID=36166 RepID=T1GUJ3_MEGSC